MSVWLAGVVLSVHPGPLPAALGEWSTQTNWGVLYRYEDLRHDYTQGVSCDCSPEEALQVILKGLPVRYKELLGSKGRSVSITWDGGQGRTPTWYTQDGWSYGCQPLSWFAGITLSREDRFAIRLGLADIDGVMLCHKSHPTESDEEIEITLDEVSVQSHRRSVTPDWGPRQRQ